ncbi:conserved hypothetical protein [Anaeromyxobacter dehalogenans 2CP-1]|uniref:DUF4440 domain-containing protein n=1 Tax=Anaeromyxobacter dehalogenans (strain ATCC BAA-258 / DSM 21875 / 2CP-1) TaxID=455488 RepID=B8J5Q9_ANAD2|nr:DUF4440 domain-containing protein [Anaeromyxobacter dehalogenans]ACL65006.1 conserved hypothetical protein [Anaeromyxobacter dehalogenans 2CP-1]
MANLARALLVAAALGASACAHSPGGRAEPDAELRAAIAAANDAFVRALVAGDARAMAAVFTEDALVIPAMQRGFVSGRGELEAYDARRVRALRYLEATITTVQLEVSGDLAWEAGTNRLLVQQGDRAPMTVTGRYLAVWRRGKDGRWRIRAELPIPDPIP